MLIAMVPVLTNNDGIKKRCALNFAVSPFLKLIRWLLNNLACVCFVTFRFVGTQTGAEGICIIF